MAYFTLLVYRELNFMYLNRYSSYWVFAKLTLRQTSILELEK